MRHPRTIPAHLLPARIPDFDLFASNFRSSLPLATNRPGDGPAGLAGARLGEVVRVE